MSLSKEQQQAFKSLHAEVRRLRELVEKDSRRAEAIEAKLRGLLSAHGGASRTVRCHEPIPPLNGGRSLSSGYTAPVAVRNGRGAAEGAVQGSWWPRQLTAPRRLLPSAGWRNYTLHGQIAKVIGVSVFGLDREALEHVVSRIAEQQSIRRDFIPLFLTDSLYFDVFRRYGYVFEYFPAENLQRQWGGAVEWRERWTRQLEYIKQKWGLSRVVSFGCGDPCSEVLAMKEHILVTTQELQETQPSDLASLPGSNVPVPEVGVPMKEPLPMSSAADPRGDVPAKRQRGQHKNSVAAK